MLPIEPPSRLVPEPRPVGIAEPVEMLRVSGDVYSVPDAATLQRWILERRVSPEDMVSQYGMRWTAIGDRPELALFFQAADRLGDAAPVGGYTDEEPYRPASRGLPMADDEEIYVQELGTEGGDPPTAVQESPAPTVGNLRLQPSPTLSPHPFKDEPTLHAVEPPPVVGPLDELPANLLVAARTADDPARLLDQPPPVPFQMEARSLGFRLDPDPDTQEETLQGFNRQEVEQAHDPTDSFMLTGVIPGSPDYAPPPVDIDGAVPRTVQPRAPWPIQDEEPPPRRGGAAPEIVIAGLLLVAGLIAVGGWLFTRKSEAPAPAEAAAVQTEAPPPPPPPAANPEDEAARAAAQAAAMAEPLSEEEATAATPPAQPPPAVVKPPAVAAEQSPPVEKPEPKPIAKAEPKPVAEAEPKPVAKAEAPAGGGSARSLTDAGWKAIDKGDLEAAHGFFARALQKDAGSAWALYGRGYANEKLGDKVSAGADYCAAQAAAGSDAELTRELSGGLRRLGRGC